MQCKNCLAPLSNGDTYCKVCGMPVEKNNAYPSNEEIIKSYNEEVTVTEQQPVFINPTPVENTVQREAMPSQSLEQTNMFKPVVEETKVEQNPVSFKSPVMDPVSFETPVAPQMPTQVTPELRPMPAPIVNESNGISKKVFAIGIVIAVVATALIAILISIPIISSKVEKAKEENASPEVQTTTVTENRALFSGYSFLIPEGYTYKISGTQLIVEKTETKEAMSLQVGTETYANLKTNITTLKTNLTTAKWTVGKIYMDQNVKNRVYLTVEATINKQKLMLAYTKANATQVFGIVYLNPSSKEYPTATIETFNEIVNSAKEVKQNPTTTITNFTKNKVFFAKTTTTTKK